MRTTFTYPVKLIKQKEGGYFVEFPNLPEAITQGESIDDALEQAMDCLEEAIANRIAMKLPIPEVKSIKNRRRSVSLSTTFAAKTALYIIMRDRHLSNVALTKKLDCDEKEVRRLLDPYYQSKIPRIEKALPLLGHRLEININRI